MNAPRLKVLALALSALGWLGCGGSMPRPTLDAGQCWPQPASATHSDDHCPSTNADDPEPNGQLTSASNGVATADGQEFKGTLGSNDDVDVFAVSTFALPKRSLLNSARKRTKLDVQADDKSRVCAFLACTTGVSSRADGAQGCEGASARSMGDAGASTGFAAHLDEGMLGCCRVGAGTLILGILCDNGGTQYVNGFVTVESVGADHCSAAYSVDLSLTD